MMTFFGQSIERFFQAEIFELKEVDERAVAAPGEGKAGSDKAASLENNNSAMEGAGEGEQKKGVAQNANYKKLLDKD